LDLKKQQQKQKTTTKTNYKYENDIKIKTTTNTITNIKNECKSKNKWIKDLQNLEPIIIIPTNPKLK
jgi:hypothetical protein